MERSLKRRIARIIFVVGAVIALGFVLQLQMGLLNLGQKFGTYGQYNRTVGIAKATKGWTVTNSRLSRRLDWRNLGHLDRFSISIQDATGKTGVVEFVDGSPEMRERNTVVLEQIIRSKLNESLDASRK